MKYLLVRSDKEVVCFYGITDKSNIIPQPRAGKLESESGATCKYMSRSGILKYRLYSPDKNRSLTRDTYSDRLLNRNKRLIKDSRPVHRKLQYNSTLALTIMCRDW